MKKVLLVMAVAAVSLLGNNAFAQDYNDDADDTHNVTIVIPEITLLDIEPETDKDITLTFGFETVGGTLQAEAGLAPTTTSQDKDIWLNYTSLKNTSTRKVTAQITAGTVPAGMTLKVTAAAPTADGAGTKGSSAGQQTLGGTAVDVITGIGSCYTDDGANKGSKLTYALEASDWTSLQTSTTSGITITYTLTD